MQHSRLWGIVEPMQDGSASVVKPPRLGPLEAQVMDALWDHGAQSVREVIDRLATNPAYTTIATVLSNLTKKGLVQAARRQHATEYSPVLVREEYVASVMNHALGSSRDRAASMLHFVETMPDSDLALLRQYLQQRDGERGSGGTTR